MNYIKKRRLQPLLKYPGGKERELKYILTALPTKINNYYEPFVGGGAVFFSLDCTSYFINDKSEDLINLYKMVQARDTEFINKLKALNHNWMIINKVMDNHSKKLVSIYKNYKASGNEERLMKKITLFINDNADEFNGILSPSFNVLIDLFVDTLAKSIFNKMKRMNKIENLKSKLPDKDVAKNIEGAIKTAFYTHFRYLYNNINNLSEITDGFASAIFLFIRQYCYSSMFRYNKSGGFNVPYGGISYNNKTLMSKIKLYEDEEMMTHLNNTTIENEDFIDFLTKYPPKKNDFIFLDPPYDTEFSTYDKNEFLKSDQIRLANYLIKECKANFMLVIKNTDFIRSLYTSGTKTKNGEQIHTSSFDKKYLVSFQDRNDKGAEHLMITNYEIIGGQI